MYWPSSDSSDSTAESDKDIWPPKVDQCISGIFEEGVFPGEVKKILK